MTGLGRRAVLGFLTFGLAGGLAGFVAAAVITGLGKGLFAIPSRALLSDCSSGRGCVAIRYADERLDSEQFSRIRGRGDAVYKWTAAVRGCRWPAVWAAPTYPFVAAVGSCSAALPCSTAGRIGSRRPGLLTVAPPTAQN